MNALAPELLLTGLLATVRVVVLVTVAPLFAHLAVPIRVRSAMALVIALVLTPTLPAPALAQPVQLASLGLAVLGEVAVGAALGFATRLVFDAIGFFGGLYATQCGLGAASVIDPSSGASSTAPSMLLEAIAMLIYLGIDGHHALLRAAAASFEVLPPGGGGPGPESMLAIATLGSQVFSIGAALAAPVTVAMLVANLALGVLGRALPEMNLMMVQIPAHVMLGFALLLAGATPLGRTLVTTLATYSERAIAAVLGGA